MKVRKYQANQKNYNVPADGALDSARTTSPGLQKYSSNCLISGIQKNYRGQAAVEFFAYAGVFLLIIIITASSIFFLSQQDNKYFESKYATEVGHSFASSYILAVAGGTGFNYTIFYPKTIMGKEYNITFNTEQYTIFINWENEGNLFSYPFSVPKYTSAYEGCILKGENSQGNPIGIVNSQKGETLNFFNDGSKLTITQKGDCS